MIAETVIARSTDAVPGEARLVGAGADGDHGARRRAVRRWLVDAWCIPVDEMDSSFRGEDSNPYTRHQKPLSYH